MKRVNSTFAFLLILTGLSACGGGSDSGSSAAPTQVLDGITYNVYHILTGNEYPDVGVNGDSFIQVGTLTRYARFDDTDNYQTADPSKQGDVNKLFGFADCGLIDHLKSSARFGWRYNLTTHLIEIFAFGEFLGNHIYQHSGVPDATIALNQSIKLSIKVKTTGLATYPNTFFVFGASGTPITGYATNSGTGVTTFVTSTSNFSGSYEYYVNDVLVATQPRVCNSAQSNGYQLYPYFGGTSVAPHTLNIYLSPL